MELMIEPQGAGCGLAVKMWYPHFTSVYQAVYAPHHSVWLWLLALAPDSCGLLTPSLLNGSDGCRSMSLSSTWRSGRCSQILAPACRVNQRMKGLFLPTPFSLSVSLPLQNSNFKYVRINRQIWNCGGDSFLRYSLNYKGFCKCLI